MSTDCESTVSIPPRMEGLCSCLPNVNCSPSIPGNEKQLLKYKKTLGKSLYQAKILSFQEKDDKNFACQQCGNNDKEGELSQQFEGMFTSRMIESGKSKHRFPRLSCLLSDFGNDNLHKHSVSYFQNEDKFNAHIVVILRELYIKKCEVQCLRLHKCLIIVNC